MSSGIETFQDGTSSFVSRNEPAWHHLGTTVQGSLSAQQAIETALLDWEVTKRPIEAIVRENETVTRVPISNKFATCRFHPSVGNHQILGIVGNKYTVIQNREAFSIIDDIISVADASFDTAGSINGGKQVFISMKLPDEIKFADQETVELYLLALNSHDGSKALELAVTPIRVVCQNTLALGLSAAKRKFNIRHTANASNRIEEARRALSLSRTYIEKFVEASTLMAERPFSQDKFEMVVRQYIIPDAENTTDRKENNINEARASIMNVWNSPTNSGPLKDTAWAAWNTLVEWYDWYSPARTSRERLVRATRTLDGTGDRFKQKAYNYVMAA